MRLINSNTYVFNGLEKNIWAKIVVNFEATKDNAKFYGIRYAALSPDGHLEGVVQIGAIKIERGLKSTF